MTHTDLIERVVARLYGKPILTNVRRGDVVEEIVAAALSPDWELCSGDYASHDLRHPTSQARIQVRQSAALQSWGKSLRQPSFSIAHKTGRWEGASWIGEPGRNAEIFVFGWHSRTDDDADHRSPDQWLFYVATEVDFPDQKSVSLAWLRRMAAETAFEDLRATVARALSRLTLPAPQQMR